MIEGIEQLAWPILLAPLAAALVIALITNGNRNLSAQLSIGAVAISFALSLVLFAGRPEESSLGLTWLEVGELKIQLGLMCDSLSALMLLIVTGVGGLIHVYSCGYMRDDPGKSRYFASLSLFTFAMLGVVLADNLLAMFIFWELVGLSSYLLIGFWFLKPSAADAGKKAFLTNRIGDFGFLLGILLVWSIFGSLNIEQIKGLLAADEGMVAPGTLTVIGLLLFCGAVGKSAQFPLHVWLPDAMEGPTPVSALIHAATMVAAGVYLLCRLFFLLSGDALTVIAWVGALTSLMAALIAIQQNDIKRILAYSTLSQLGYMVMAVGLSGPHVGMFHLTTHACFKALLFLGAGALILATRHEQDIWRMGGLRGKTPTTYWTFLLATLALCGAPPLSGFFSKDAILALAFEQHLAMAVIAAIVALLTAFYMFRLILVVFHGGARSHAASQAEEAPWVMTAPLLLLAIPTALAGFWGIDAKLAEFYGHERHADMSWVAALLYPINHAPGAAFFGMFAIFLGFSFAYSMYRNAESDPLPGMIGAMAGVLKNRFYLDELYQWSLVKAHDFMGYVADFADRWFIAGLLVRGAHGSTELAGRLLRLSQTGNIHTYIMLFALGVTIVALALIGRS